MNIIIKDIKKTFGDKVAVDIPELTIHSGELIGLVGNNGAGKSTLFRLMLDLIKADTGTVRMVSTDVDVNVAETECWKDWTGAFVDEGFLIDYLTPDEYFQFIARLTDTSDEQLQDFLAHYDTASFIKEDGSVDITTNVEVLTNLCMQRGMVCNDQLQTVAGLTIYPREVFCPVDYDTEKLNRTRKTVTIHWFSGSWHTEEELEAMRQEKLQQRRERSSNLRYAIGKKLFGEEGYKKLKGLLKRQ